MKPGLTLMLLLVFSPFLGQAQDLARARQQQFNLDNGLAIQGYDPVSYFTKGKAEKGKKEWALVYLGVRYYFSSAENREIFRKDPAHYEPCYGGWCAYAMGARGEKVSVDPETFKIVKGKLYLFYNRFFNNTLTDWNKDERHLMSSADSHWQSFYHP